MGKDKIPCIGCAEGIADRIRSFIRSELGNISNPYDIQGEGVEFSIGYNQALTDAINKLCGRKE